MEVRYEEQRMCGGCRMIRDGVKPTGVYPAPAKLVCPYCGGEDKYYSVVAYPPGSAVVLEDRA